MAAELPKLTVKDYKEEDVHVDWCPGCGDFGALNAVQMALAKLQWDPSDVALFSGIGCSGKSSQYVRTYGIHTLHGRVLAFATGAKLANPHLKVVALGGDGDGYGIGACHFLNAGRRNLDLAYIVYSNNVYGLTKGQASPTMPRAAQTKSLPEPNINDSINPIATAIAAGYTWIGRAYAFDVKGMTELIVQAIQHEGAALLDILQPCPTYNNLRDKAFYQPRVVKLDDEGYDGAVADPTDAKEIAAKQAGAIAQSLREDEFPTGVFYSVRKPTYEERVADRMPDYPNTYPAKQDSWMEADGAPKCDLDPMWKDLRLG